MPKFATFKFLLCTNDVRKADCRCVNGPLDLSYRSMRRKFQRLDWQLSSPLSTIEGKTARGNYSASLSSS
jgi:hypothetical protein